MNIASSIRSLKKNVAISKSFTRLGIPSWWYLRLFYQGRWAVRRNAVQRPSVVHFSVNDVPVNLTLAPVYLGAFRGVFLEAEYQLKERYPARPAVIFDLGANIGMGSIYLNTLFPGAKYICIEPDPRNIALLKDNLKANVKHSVVFEGAAGPDSGDLMLRFGNSPTCSSIQDTNMHDFNNEVKVRSYTVAEMMREASVDHIDLLKMDIEGAEDLLLSSNNEWLSKVDAIVLEIHPNTTPEKILSYIKPYGFSLVRTGFGSEPVFFASKSK